ncbi:GumC family protein [Persicitalea jodogahamensis]|uniref:non-specific protein-tyrosine kinase n=1 Tax=Persicitalea jodogahamensis TaxID=402147 RepID=A0A8J3G8H9_9BACT|nr:polysaccharide biosynthesis tyrosine autokinase [Persicitalea jodogahamensis]GHB55260.1 tyrosine protein kinase [Persicitalea jodogahamensis]
MRQETDSALFEQLLGNSESINFRKLLQVFKSRWWWILIALLLAGALCFLYLKFVTPQYIGTVTLKYLDKQSEFDGLTGSKPMFIFGTSSPDYLTEKFNVRSPEVVRSTLERMNNPFTFYRVKDLRQIDVYPARPLVLEVLSYDPAKYQHGTFFLDEDLTLRYQTEESVTRPLQLVRGAIVTLPGLVFRISEIVTAAGYKFEFKYNDPARLVNAFVWRIDMEETEEQMPVMDLTFRHHNEAYTEHFLVNLVEAYRDFDLRQKQKSSDLTIGFINKQVGIYSGYLKESARELELFKQKNQLLDVSTSALEITSKVRELEQRKNELEIQRSYIDMLEANMGRTFETVNYLSVGLDGTSDGVLIGLLQNFNDLITQRKQLLQKYSPNSAAVKNLDEQLVKYRSQILDNIRLQNQKNERTLKILNDNLSALKGRFSRIPALEKNFIYLQSDFEVNKNIYSLLLNKEIESSIVKAGMLPSFTVITQLDTDKVSPIAWRIILLFMFAGLALGIGSVLLARSINSTFTDIGKVAQHPGVSLLGLIHHFSEKVTNTPQDLTSFLNDRTVFTESLSAIRTRLSFAKSALDAKTDDGGQLILVTSERAGEGKSFVTVNLALSFTKIGKKVIVVGADLRKSRIHLFFDAGQTYGLSDFLQDPEEIDRAVYASTIENLDYIPAGFAPFNPAELLQKPAMQELLRYCRKNYDYVLLDTAPVGLVADNVPLLPQSDFVIFIVRWLYSNQESYHLAGQLADEYELKDVKVVINDFYPDNLHSSLSSGSGYYGSGSGSYQYGYAYQNDGYLTDSRTGWRKNLRKVFGRN